MHNKIILVTRSNKKLVKDNYKIVNTKVNRITAKIFDTVYHSDTSPNTSSHNPKTSKKIKNKKK